MGKTKMVCIRISKDILESFDKIAEELGVSRSELIKAIMLNIVIARVYFRRPPLEMYKIPFGRRGN